MTAIPIIVGVTGHRNLRPQDTEALRQLVRNGLCALGERYPHSPVQLLCSVASGADLLCAEVALDMGISLVCPLPLPIEEYRKDFDGADALRFDAAVARASEVFVAPACETPQGEVTRDFCYRQAGAYVARHSHVLLALWDGAPAKPHGCGTAEAVGFMLRGDEQCADAPLFETDGAVWHILTPRDGDDDSPSPTATLLENTSGSLAACLAMTDAFNAEDEPSGGYPLLPPQVARRLRRKAAAHARAISKSRHAVGTLSKSVSQSHSRAFRAGHGARAGVFAVRRV